MYKIALVGKPNVGKSTLFNRIINKKHAIVDDQPGVTRDRLLANATWLNKSFIIIDTGGLTNKEIPFQQNIEQQVKFAIAESNAIIFLVSAKERINQEDYYIAKLLKKYKGKQILLVVNKTENLPQQNINQYYSLGFGEPLFIASEHGIGIGDLLDQIIKPIKVNSAVKVVNNSFCVIGRTNVGKSTLVNTILREERVLVSPIPHTTRDSVDVTFKYDNQSFTIIDTAGIRRKGKITDNIEKYAVMRTQQAIERSQTIIFLLDGNSQISEQDEVIGGLAYEKNIPTIICVNKWDKVKKNQSTMNETTKLIRQRFKYLSWAPIIFISAKNNKRIHTIFTTINAMQKQININVSTSLLNDVIAKAQISNPPPLFKGGRINLSYATQVKSQIPTFVIFSNNPKFLHLSYARYIENQIRESFGLNMVPITVYYKDKNARIRGVKEK